MNDDRGDEAAVRRRAAEERAAELEELRERLERGERVTAADLTIAGERLEAALHRAENAHEHAISAHQHAAQRHREAADVAQRGGYPDRAEHHRRAADAEELAAIKEQKKQDEDHELRKQAHG